MGNNRSGDLRKRLDLLKSVVEQLDEQAPLLVLIDLLQGLSGVLTLF